MKEEMYVAEADYQAILSEIYKEDSPVGIDAQKTHIVILHKLIEIEKRLNAIEAKL
jgi:hypothetical protein